MVKIGAVTNGSPISQEEGICPFYIIRDYRKTAKLKKQREWRKMKMNHEREAIKDMRKEEKKVLIEQINRSMLDEDDVWSRVQDGAQLECDEECYTTDHEASIDKKIQKLRWEVLFTLGPIDKKPLFSEFFPAFEFIQ
jgi:hypothetical protein